MGHRIQEAARAAPPGGGMGGGGESSWRQRSLVEPTYARVEVIAPTVFVVDDELAMRESLSWLLRSVGLVAETYASAEEFLAAYNPIRPGCAVVDMRLPGMSGLQLQAELLRRQFQLPVIFITGYGEVPMAVRALKAGAVDFIEKPFSDQHLLDRIHQAIRADRDARSARAMRAGLAHRVQSLTTRQRDVMELVAVGLPNKAIAKELGASVKTIEAHRGQMMKKLGMDSVADLVRLVAAWQQPPTRR